MKKHDNKDTHDNIAHDEDFYNFLALFVRENPAFSLKTLMS